MKHLQVGVAVLLLSMLVPAVRVQTAQALQAQGPAIEVLHVIPAGVTPRFGDMDERIAATIEAVQVFLQQDVGRTLRFAPGTTVITVSDGTDGQIAQQISNQLADPDKIFLGFVESPGGVGACGRTFLADPGEAPISLVLMPACDIYPEAGPQVFPGGATYLVLHELLHALGAVPACAPNYIAGGHSNDSRADMLYAGPGGRDWDNLTIDVGNNDYYGHVNLGCPDIEDSPYWSDVASPLRCAGKPVTIDMTAGASGVGTAGPDVILGTSGPDVIDAGGGDDTVCAGDGADTVTGGDGNDLLLGGRGNDVLRGNAGSDTIRGGSGADRLLGGIAGDVIYGNDGDDYLGGFGGSDNLLGGFGNDTIFGGFGGDIIDGGDGDDTIRGLVGNDDIFGGPGNDTLDGDRGNDVLAGGDGNDVARGGSASDIVRGDAGNDTISGGKADDQLIGGSGFDICAGNAHVIADAAVSCETEFGIP